MSLHTGHVIGGLIEIYEGTMYVLGNVGVGTTAITGAMYVDGDMTTTKTFILC